jgi:chorismate synthase
MIVANQDQRPFDYSETDLYPRPSHADYTYLLKYNMKSSSGGGRSSARETIGILIGHLWIGRVAAGAIAEKYLSVVHQVEIVAFVASVGEVAMNMPSDYNENGFMKEWEEWWSFLKQVQRHHVDSTLVRCPDALIAQKMEKVEFIMINQIENFECKRKSRFYRWNHCLCHSKCSGWFGRTLF